MADESIFDVREKPEYDPLEVKPKKRGRGQKRRIAGAICAVALVFALLITGAAAKNEIEKRRLEREQAKQPEIITVERLEKLINVSELSTFKAVYNGVAKVMSKDDPTETDYYVSYDSTVSAGMDFEKINIAVDSAQKRVIIDMPEVYITEINVDISSMDYIFINDKANASSVSGEAFKACEADVSEESGLRPEIIELAEKNAENILTALVKPIVEQLDPEYTLIIR